MKRKRGLTCGNRTHYVVHQLLALLQVLRVIKSMLLPSNLGIIARTRARVLIDAKPPFECLQLGALGLRSSLLACGFLLQIFGQPMSYVESSSPTGGDERTKTKQHTRSRTFLPL